MSAPKNGFQIIRQCAGLSPAERFFLETVRSFEGPLGACPGNERLMHELECSEHTLERTVGRLAKSGLIQIRRYRVAGSWRRQFLIQWDELAKRKRPDFKPGSGGDYLPKMATSGDPDTAEMASSEGDYLPKVRGTSCQKRGGLVAKSAEISSKSFSSKASKDLNPNPTPSKAGGDLNLPTPLQGTAGEKIVSPPVPRSAPPGLPEPIPRNPFRDTCRSYSEAYFARYGVAPLLDGRALAVLKRFVAAVGDDAPAIAAFYLQHSKRFYLERSHDPALLMVDAHALRTQFLTGRVVTTLDAQASERLSTFENQRNWLVERIYAERDAETLQ